MDGRNKRNEHKSGNNSSAKAIAPSTTSLDYVLKQIESCRKQLVPGSQQSDSSIEHVGPNENVAPTTEHREECPRVNPGSASSKPSQVSDQNGDWSNVRSIGPLLREDGNKDYNRKTEESDPIHLASRYEETFDQDGKTNASSMGSPMLDNLDIENVLQTNLVKYYGCRDRAPRHDGNVPYLRPKSHRIYLINDKGQVIDKDRAGNPIISQLHIYPGSYQPRMSINVAHGNHEDDLLAEPAGTTSQDFDEKGTQSFTSGGSTVPSSISATYLYRCIDQELLGDGKNSGLGVSLVELEITEAATGPSQAYFASLPSQTASLISRISSSGKPSIFLCTIVHRENGILDTRLFHDVPDWAGEVAPILRNRETQFLIQGSKQTDQAINAFVAYWEHTKYPYLKFHLNGKKDNLHYHDDAMSPAGSIDLSHRAYQFVPIYQSQDIHELGTLYRVIANESIKVVNDKATRFKEKIYKLLILPAEDIKDKTHYYGFIEVVTSEKESLTTGDTMQISFDLQEAWDIESQHRTTQLWYAEVCKPLSIYLGEDWHPILITRPRITDTGQYDSYEPKITGSTTMQADQLEQILRQSCGQDVRARLNTDNSVMSNIKFHIDLLLSPPNDKPLTIFNERMKQVLCGTRLDLLSQEDFFQEPREELGNDLLQYMDLDTDQAEVVKQAGKALGGITLYCGPPGTGKTTLFIQAIVPFLLCTKSTQQVVVLAPTNLMADDLIKRIHLMMQNLGIANHHVRGKYAVRVYSHAADCRYRDLQAVRARLGNSRVDDMKQPEPNPSSEDIDAMFEALPPVSQDIANVIKESQDYPTQGVPDRRFRLAEFSPARYMLESTGPIGHTETWSDVLQRAAVIVSTTAGMTSQNVLQAIESTTTALVFECSTSESEISYMPIFAARFQRDPNILVIGDRRPLPSRIPIDSNHMVLARQCQIDLVTRMKMVGHHCRTLYTNYRMNPAISEPLNSTIYDGQLVSHCSTGSGRRPLAGPFKQFLNKNFGKGYLSSIWMNTDPVKDNRSRSEIYLDTTLQMVEPLLKIVDGDTQNTLLTDTQVGSSRSRPRSKLKIKRSPPRIAIVALCEDQKNVYLLAKGRMQMRNVKQIDNLQIVNTDSAQNLDWDYVFVDLCLNPKAKSAVESSRLHVALSRARDGLVIIGDAAQVDQMKGAQFIKDLKRFYVKNSRVYHVKSTNCVVWPSK